MTSQRFEVLTIAAYIIVGLEKFDFCLIELLKRYAVSYVLFMPRFYVVYKIIFYREGFGVFARSEVKA